MLPTVKPPLRRLLLVALFAVFAAPAQAASSAPTRARAPNILVVTIDNLGYADLGCFGNPLVQTPNINALARDGVRCTAFYSASPTCSPSRGSLLTGRYPQRNGLNVQLPGIKGNWGVGLRPEEKLIPAYLKPAGYATGCFGKWNVGFAPGTRPTEEGFDELIGTPAGQIDYYTYKYQGKPALYRGTEEYHSDQYATDLWADAAIDFIRRNAERPFFVYLPFNAPHSVDPDNYRAGERVQFRVPDKYLELYGSKPDEESDRIRYFAVISAMDDAFGRVLHTLDELALRDDTLVIFYNDNGANTSREHGLKFATNAPYRGGRPDCWEGGIRVPAVFRWPGRLPANVDCDEPLIATDILPMLLAAARVAQPVDRVLDGIDPTDILAGRRPAPDRTLFWEYGSRSVHTAVRHGRHKLIRTGKEKPFELYDIVADPSELRNLAAEHPETVARLTAAYERWRRETDASGR